MTKKEHITYWLESAEHDFSTAKSLFDSKKYDWSLFIGHLVLEKTLKAIYIDRTGEMLPPKIHNLSRLAEVCSLELSQNERFDLDKINDFNIEARYPNFKLDFYKKCDEKYTTEYFYKIEEFYKWFQSLIK
jgi:HEPN domain-containing protein